MKIYFVEQILFEGVDETDGERIEDRYPVGYFDNEASADKAMKEAALAEGNREYSKTEYDMYISPRQKWLYVLNHEYETPGGEIVYYIFSPQTSRKDCIKQKAALATDPKYAYSKDRIYYTGKDGWYIEKHELTRAVKRKKKTT